jgi:hypothetical protein
MYICILRSELAGLDTEYSYIYIYIEVAVLETEHTVNVEALQALLLEVCIYVSSYYYICVLMSHI